MMSEGFKLWGGCNLGEHKLPNLVEQVLTDLFKYRGEGEVCPSPGPKVSDIPGRKNSMIP